MGILNPRKRTPIGYQRSINAALKGAVPIRSPKAPLKGVDLAHWILNWMPTQLAAAKTLGVAEVSVLNGPQETFDSEAAQEILRVCWHINLTAHLDTKDDAQGIWQHSVIITIPKSSVRNSTTTPRP